jgi:ATP-dependent Clp protease ATP-binding subunit ClpA
MREVISENTVIAKKLDELERRVGRRLADQDCAIHYILRAIRELTATPRSEPKKRPIGFITPKEK